MCSGLSFGDAKSSSFSVPGRGYSVFRRGNAAGSGSSGEHEAHRKTCGCRRRLMSVLVCCLGWRSCGGATGVLGGSGCRSKILASWRPAQGAKAYRMRTCWAVIEGLATFLRRCAAGKSHLHLRPGAMRGRRGIM